jgi:hypothetical protein
MLIDIDSSQDLLQEIAIVTLVEGPPRPSKVLAQFHERRRRRHMDLTQYFEAHVLICPDEILVFLSDLRIHLLATKLLDVIDEGRYNRQSIASAFFLGENGSRTQDRAVLLTAPREPVK